MSPPKPKSIEKSSCHSAVEHSTHKKTETDAAEAETRAEMNRSAYPPHGGADSSAGAPEQMHRRTHSRTDAESNNDGSNTNKQNNGTATQATNRDSPTETNEVAKSRRFF
jgi:hypothetical protein